MNKGIIINKSDDNLQLTKREYFVAMAMQGLCVNSYCEQEIAEMAVEIADATLLEMEKTK